MKEDGQENQSRAERDVWRTAHNWEGNCSMDKMVRMTEGRISTKKRRTELNGRKSFTKSRSAQI